MTDTRLIKLLTVIVFILGLVVTFELGVYVNYRKQISQQVAGLSTRGDDYAAQIYNLQQELQQKDQNLLNLQDQQSSSNQDKQTLQGQIADLQVQLEQLRALQLNASKDTVRYPYLVPANGIAASAAGLFGGILNGERHYGIDIWATAENSGHLASHKGNPVYAACAGKVVDVVPENGAVIILCDDLPADRFDVLKLTGVYTYYGHLGNGDTKQLYIMVQRNQRVNAGQQLGFQGDLSSFYPEMRNVHVHFSIFTGRSETDPNGGALNPCLYIGGSCTTVGEVFRI